IFSASREGAMRRSSGHSVIGLLWALAIPAMILSLSFALRSPEGGGGDVALSSGPDQTEKTTVLMSLQTAEAVAGATVQVDQADYYPGQTVIITGSGWKADEVVR